MTWKLFGPRKIDQSIIRVLLDRMPSQCTTNEIVTALDRADHRASVARTYFALLRLERKEQIASTKMEGEVFWRLL